MPLTDGMKRHSNNVVKDGCVTYTIDCHGKQLTTNPKFEPPEGIQIIFYSDSGSILCINKAVKSQICAGGFISHVNDIKEIVENREQEQNSGLCTAGRTRSSEINYLYNTYDYELTPDKNNTFLSGIKDCKSNKIIYAIKNVETLSGILKILNSYHKDIYGNNSLAQLHCLFCRETENGPGVVTTIRPNGSSYTYSYGADGGAGGGAAYPSLPYYQQQQAPQTYYQQLQQQQAPQTYYYGQRMATGGRRKLRRSRRNYKKNKSRTAKYRS